MIKLINCDRRLVEPQVVYISKDNIGDMMRRETDDVMYTEISTKEERPYTYFVKETPEEILTMPDIETTEKVIDWEQRRYEIAKQMLPAIYVDDHPQEGEDYLTIQQAANEAVRYADALINELKKGQDNEN